MLKHGILGLLNYGAMTGYEIKTVFQASLNYFWTAQTSQIYRELQTLKKKGWVKDELVSQQGKPDKKPFTITEEGKEELQRWLKDKEQVTMPNSPLMMKTFFLGELPAEDNFDFFRKIKEDSLSFLEEVNLAEGAIDSYRGYIPSPEKALYWQMTLEYGIMYREMSVRWAQRCMEMLKEAQE